MFALRFDLCATPTHSPTDIHALSHCRCQRKKKQKTTMGTETVTSLSTLAPHWPSNCFQIGFFYNFLICQWAMVNSQGCGYSIRSILVENNALPGPRLVTHCAYDTLDTSKCQKHSANAAKHGMAWRILNIVLLYIFTPKQMLFLLP